VNSGPAATAFLDTSAWNIPGDAGYNYAGVGLGIGFVFPNTVLASGDLSDYTISFDASFSGYAEGDDALPSSALVILQAFDDDDADTDAESYTVRGDIGLLTTTPQSFSINLADFSQIRRGGSYANIGTEVRSFTQKVENTPNKQVVTKLLLAGDKGGALTPGVYLVQTSSPETLKQYQYPSYQFLTVGTANLTFKLAPNEVMVWATDLKSGQPIAGAPIQILDENGTQIAAGITDTDGLFRAHVSETYNKGQLWAMTQHPNDRSSLFGLATNYAGGVSPYDYGVSENRAPQKVNIYLYTDQPIYRPGAGQSLRKSERWPIVFDPNWSC
jgi:hypothetical protein